MPTSNIPPENHTPSTVKPIRPKSGINKRLLKVFLLQMVFISMVTLLGVLAAAQVVEGVMMRTALAEEADYFWQVYQQDAKHPLPNTNNLVGYLFNPNNTDSVNTLPASITQLTTGFGRIDLNGETPLVWVEDKFNQRLVLVFDEQSVVNLSIYFGIVPLSIILMVIYLSAWVAFRQSRKLVSPLVQLAKLISTNSPDEPTDDVNAFLQALNQTKSNYSNDEINVLTDALAGYTTKINNLLERERSFTRDASHELRTPLTIIQGSVDWLLSQDNLNTKQSQAAYRIKRTCKDMHELVNMFLLLARQQNHVAEERSQVSVNDVTKTLITNLQPANTMGTVIKLDAQHPLTVQTSSQILTVVLSNLIRNAINHTHGEPIYITIDTQGFAIRNYTQLDDINTERLFSPYYQHKHTTTNTTMPDKQDVSLTAKNNQLDEGHGLGLDIVKRLCDKEGWQIKATYSEQWGLEFWVNFKGF